MICVRYVDMAASQPFAQTLGLRIEPGLVGDPCPRSPSMTKFTARMLGNRCRVIGSPAASGGVRAPLGGQDVGQPAPRHLGAPTPRCWRHCPCPAPGPGHRAQRQTSVGPARAVGRRLPSAGPARGSPAAGRDRGDGAVRPHGHMVDLGRGTKPAVKIRRPRHRRAARWWKPG